MDEVLVTGATGFVGKYVVSELLKRGRNVAAMSRSMARLREMPWFDKVRPVQCDMAGFSEGDVAKLGGVSTLIHLAWDGLPNYKSLHHLESGLPTQIAFLRQLIETGIRQVLVAGTCFEYGLQNGVMDSATEARPMTSYAIAKDTLHRYLRQLALQQPFNLVWGRLFYMYGAGQHPRSLLAQLNTAIERGDRFFDMSLGEQLRDYQSVEETARQLVDASTNNFGEILNICSGVPISVRRLVEDFIQSHGASIEIRLGKMPYPDYEPLAYWGRRQF